MRLLWVSILGLVIASSVFAGPKVFILDPARMEQTRVACNAGDSRFIPALDALKAQAEAALTVQPVSVIDDDLVPTSGDKHDYASLSIYAWPNPNTPDGKPYIIHDGEFNPEANQYDGGRIPVVTGTVETLALAWWFTGEEKYAEHAARLLRVWFLDEATRMNPHLQYAQFVPGDRDGKHTGIIDTAVLAYQLIDAVGLLENSIAWSDADQIALQEWFGQYLTWLRESDNGQNETSELNNHGVYYDLQVVMFALFTGDEEFAQKQISEVTLPRFDLHFLAGGQQMFELMRTKAFDYSVYNLQAFFGMASVGEKLGVDVWHHKNKHGAGLSEALGFLQTSMESGKWPFKQIVPLKPESLCAYLRRATIAYQDVKWEEASQRLVPGDHTADRLELLWPLD